MMSKEEIRALLATILDRGEETPVSPTNQEWEVIEDIFHTHFPHEFKSFIELMAEFSFPGDIYNVLQSGKTNGNDDILTVYKIERSESAWPINLIPFYGIGNGDYFALDALEREKSAVYYRYHEDGRIEKTDESFEIWLKNLPHFLSQE